MFLFNSAFYLVGFSAGFHVKSKDPLAKNCNPMFYLLFCDNLPAVNWVEHIIFEYVTSMTV